MPPHKAALVKGLQPAAGMESPKRKKVIQGASPTHLNQQFQDQSPPASPKRKKLWGVGRLQVDAGARGQEQPEGLATDGGSLGAGVKVSWRRPESGAGGTKGAGGVPTNKGALLQREGDARLRRSAGSANPAPPGSVPQDSPWDRQLDKAQSTIYGGAKGIRTKSTASVAATGAEWAEDSLRVSGAPTDRQTHQTIFVPTTFPRSASFPRSAFGSHRGLAQAGAHPAQKSNLHGATLKRDAGVEEDSRPRNRGRGSPMLRGSSLDKKYDNLTPTGTEPHPAPFDRAPHHSGLLPSGSRAGTPQRQNVRISGTDHRGEPTRPDAHRRLEDDADPLRRKGIPRRGRGTYRNADPIYTHISIGASAEGPPVQPCSSGKGKAQFQQLSVTHRSPRRPDPWTHGPPSSWFEN